MKKNQNYKIPIVIILLIVTVMVTLSVMYLSYLQKITDENTLMNLGELAKQDAAKIENQIEQHKRMLENIIDQIDKKTTEKDIFRIYEDNIAYEEFSRLAIMHKNGTTITSDGETVALSDDIEEFFSSDDIKVSQSRKSKVDQEEINIYSKKIEIETEEVVIMLVVETSKYENIFEEAVYDGRGYEYIINSNGEIIANSQRKENNYNLIEIINKLEDKESKDKLEEMKANISIKQNGQDIYKVEEKNYYIAYKYLNVNDWYLVIIAPASIIAEEYNTSLKLTFIISIVIDTIALIIATYIVVSNKRKKEKLYNLAYIDRLTKIGNKNYFIENGTEEIKDREKNFATLTLDIDKFKSFNKKNGRETGDRLLEIIADKLNNRFGRKYLVARLSNDMFAILYKENKGIKLKKSIISVIENIEKDLENIEIEGIKYKIIISIGVYILEKGDNIYEALDKTLIAHSKTKGKYNQKYYIFNEKLEEELIKEHEIESIMEEGIEQEEFQIYYQPKVSTKTGKVTDSEALVRWIRNGEVISPASFIPIFEKNKFIIKLDKYIYESVCKDISDWKRKYDRKITVSINVSKEHLMEEMFVEEYCKIAKKYGIEPNEIELEITESATVDENFDMLGVMKKIKEAGFRISIDDFGTGYSSLSMLQNMPVDVLKIDKSFINQKDILETIMLISKKLNLKTVAEGVETEEQVKEITDLNVDLIQGYYFSKPLEKTEFEKYWQNN